MLDEMDKLNKILEGIKRADNAIKELEEMRKSLVEDKQRLKENEGPIQEDKEAITEYEPEEVWDKTKKSFIHGNPEIMTVREFMLLYFDGEAMYAEYFEKDFEPASLNKEETRAIVSVAIGLYLPTFEIPCTMKKITSFSETNDIATNGDVGGKLLCPKLGVKIFTIGTLLKFLILKAKLKPTKEEYYNIYRLFDNDSLDIKSSNTHVRQKFLDADIRITKYHGDSCEQSESMLT